MADYLSLREEQLGYKECFDRCGVVSIEVPATERDPYYCDELARKLQEASGLDSIRVTLDRPIPIARALNMRNYVVPGTEGVPLTAIRADLAFKYLERTYTYNCVALKSIQDGARRVSYILDRGSEYARWIILEADLSDTPPPSYYRMTSAYYPRGRGAYPWWKGDMPGTVPSTGTVT